VHVHGAWCVARIGSPPPPGDLSSASALLAGGLAQIAASQNTSIFNRDKLGPPANGSNVWNIVNGSLYMNAAPTVQHKWLPNVTAFVQVTDALWTSWYGGLHAGPFNTDCLQGHQHEDPEAGQFCWCEKHPQPLPPAL
jgi:hypothetical protein